MKKPPPIRYTLQYRGEGYIWRYALASGEGLRESLAQFAAFFPLCRESYSFRVVDAFGDLVDYAPPLLR